MVLPALLRVGASGVWAAGRGFGFLQKSPFLAGALSTGAATMFIKPIKQLLDYSSGWIAPIDMVDPYTLVRGLWIAPEGHGEWLKQLRYHGINEEVAKQLWRLSMRWLTVDEILQLYLLGVIDEKKAFHWHGEDGQIREVNVTDLLYGAQIPDEWHGLILGATNRPLPLEIAAQLYRRFGDYEKPPPGTSFEDWPIHPDGGKYRFMFDRARRLEGLKDELPEDILNATRVYPPVGDLITMAVREVWDPVITEKYRQFEDIPEGFIREARKSGLAPEYARWYWAAHWRLPGIEQGFKMFQRKIIDGDELGQLLYALDIMPWWRDKLTQLAYRKITRVDVRRLYKYGVIEKIDPTRLTLDTPLVKAHTDLGYAPEDAKKLAVWVDLYYPSPKVDAAIREASSAFIDGFLDIPEFEVAIGKLGLPPDTAIFVIAGAKAKRSARLLKRTVTQWSPRLRDKDITEAEFRAKLEEFGLSSSALARIIDEVRAETVEKRRGLTATQVLRLYKAGLKKPKATVIGEMVQAGLNKAAATALVGEVDKRKESGSGLIRLEDMLGWFGKGDIDAKRFRKYLVMEGLSKWAVDLYLKVEVEEEEVEAESPE